METVSMTMLWLLKFFFPCSFRRLIGLLPPNDTRLACFDHVSDEVHLSQLNIVFVLYL
jgi:hypothetical protein